MYRIKGWSKHFEKSDHRKVKKITWVSTPTSLDSLGRLKIMAQPNGFEILGVWEGLVAIAANAPVELRGSLAGADGEPYTIEDIALKLRGSIEVIERVVPVLIRVGWLIDDAPAAEEVSGNFRKSPEESGERRENSRLPYPTLPDSTEDTLLSVQAPPKTAKPEPDPPLSAEVAAEWNRIATETPQCDLPKCRERDGVAVLPKSLRGKVKARRGDFDDDAEFLAEFRSRASRVCQSPFHRGENDRGWRASLAWLLEPGSWEKAAAIPLPGERNRLATARGPTTPGSAGFVSLRARRGEISASPEASRNGVIRDVESA